MHCAEFLGSESFQIERESCNIPRTSVEFQVNFCGQQNAIRTDLAPLEAATAARRPVKTFLIAERDAIREDMVERERVVVTGLVRGWFV